MAIETPTFNNPDGQGTTTQLALVTSVREVTLTGNLPDGVVDVQVKINNDSFVSDPSLVLFDQETFTVPNPNVFPQGLRLDFGVNTIQVRIIDVTGGISAAAVATVEVVREDQLDLVVNAPSGLRVRRRSDEVELVWASNGNPNVIGYNVYASTESGGGNEGYFRLNQNLITESAFQEETFVEIDDPRVFYDREGAQLRILLVEEDFNDNPIKTVDDRVVEVSNLGSDRIRVTTVVEDVETTEFFNFFHDRADDEADGVINNEVFASIPNDEPLFYVITAVAYDPLTNQQLESTYSSELVGLPLVISTRLREIPTRTQEDIQRDYIQSIIRGNNRISAIPGSVVRDVFVEPFSSEEERLHFIANFIRRSQSFLLLLEIDDLDGDGESDPVSENAYKTALKNAFALENDSDVQALIDDAFERLAENSQVARQGSETAIGQVTFYTTSEPTTDLVVPAGTIVATTGEDGSAAVNFETTSRIVLPFDQRESFFDIQNQRYEIQANIQALEAGEAGNVAANEITRVLGGTSVFQVINEEATRFGRDQESNARLAERAILAFSSVDAGTASGYLATALRQPGVFRARIVKARDEFMMRDYDPLRMKHIGGKVDVWLQGLEERQVSDTFALPFQVAENVRFLLDSSPSDLIFVADDPRLSPDNPITEMLGTTAQQISQGFGFRNVTTAQDFDLTNVSILSYNRIQLDTTIAQPAVSSNDIVVGDFRFQTGSEYVFSRQPVRDVETVRSLNANTVLEDGVNYDLSRTEDPLLEGYSTEAQDTLILRSSSAITLGNTFFVNDERHVLVGETAEPLDNLGVNPVSVRVFTLDRTTEYDGPFSADPDFLIEEGDEVTPLNIVRVPTGDISNGEEVSVDYEHDENFEVEYTINNLLNRVQAEINDQRHVTADVLVKQSVINEVVLEMTVILTSGAVQSQVDAELRTAISQLLNSKAIGEPVYQSDVVQAVEGVEGVVFVVVPFAKMALSDGSLVVREDVNNDSTFIEQQGSVKVVVFQDVLEFPTIDEGGDEFTHKGVFEDTQALNLVSSYSDLFDAAGNAVIVGNNGLNISGYSDDATLTAQGFNTAEEREEQRRALTANRVFVALDEQDSSEIHEYSVTYSVFGDSGSKSLLTQDVAFLELGDLTVTYRRE